MAVMTAPRGCDPNPGTDPLSVATQGVRWLYTITGSHPASDFHRGIVELLWTWWDDGHFTINPLILAGAWQADPILPADQRCPDGGGHTWGWHNEDGSGRPITGGVYCDACGARGTEEQDRAMHRNRMTAQRVGALRS